MVGAVATPMACSVLVSTTFQALITEQDQQYVVAAVSTRCAISLDTAGGLAIELLESLLRSVGYIRVAKEAGGVIRSR